MGEPAHQNILLTPGSQKKQGLGFLLCELGKA